MPVIVGDCLYKDCITNFDILSRICTNMPMVCDRTPAGKIIDAFGGIRAMQRALREKHPNLIKNWSASGRIPHYREDQIRRAAAEQRVNLPEASMLELFPKAAA